MRIYIIMIMMNFMWLLINLMFSSTTAGAFVCFGQGLSDTVIDTVAVDTTAVDTSKVFYLKTIVVWNNTSIEEFIKGEESRRQGDYVVAEVPVVCFCYKVNSIEKRYEIDSRKLTTNNIVVYFDKWRRIIDKPKNIIKLEIDE